MGKFPSDKVFPRHPRQSEQKRQQPGPHLKSDLYPRLFFQQLPHTPSAQGWKSAPREVQGGRAWSCGGSCHPAAASQRQTEPSVTFPDKLAPTPPSRQAWGPGLQDRTPECEKLMQRLEKKNRSPSFRTAGPRGLRDKPRLAFFFPAVLFGTSALHSPTRDPTLP